MKAADDRWALELSLKEDRVQKLIEDLEIETADIYAYDYYLSIYASDECIDAIEKHEYVSYVTMWYDYTGNKEDSYG